MTQHTNLYATQPEALRLADELESCSLHVGDPEQAQAAAELRRLHDFIARLLDPEDLGHAVTAEVRQKASALLGRTKYD
jgi:hypothetical protein